MTLREKINEYAGKMSYVGNFLTYEINPKINAMGIVTFGLVTYLTFSAVNEAKAAKGSAEVMVGNENSTLETKLSGKIVKEVGFFAKDRRTVVYGTDDSKKNQVKSFSIVDINYPVRGVEAVAEMQFPSGADFGLRGGLKYIVKAGDGGFILSTVGINGDLEVLTEFRYKPIEKINLVGRIETVNKISSKFYNFIQRIRVGFSSKGYFVGVAVDISEKRKGPISYNAGVFVKRDF